MTLTIHTDASYASDFKVASWAYIIELGEFKVQRSGRIKHDVENNSIAELLAFEKAIKAVNKMIPEDVRPLANVIAYTDSQWTINAMTNPKTNNKHKMLVKAINHLGSKYKTITINHTKAHTSSGSPEALANSWCDHAAKSVLRKEGFI